MTLARIIASLSEEASRLAEHLNDLGFDVELVTPDEVPSAPADVELRVEAFSVPAAFERAGQVAGDAAAIYVSPELLNPVEEAVPQEPAPMEVPSMVAEQPVATEAVEIEPAFEFEEIMEQEDEDLEPASTAPVSIPAVERAGEPVAFAAPPERAEVAERVPRAAPVAPRPNRVAEGVVTLGESALAAGEAVGSALARAGSDLRWLAHRLGRAAAGANESARSAWRSHAEARAARRAEKDRARQEMARRQEELRVELERKRQEIQAKRVEEERLRLARQEQRRLEQEKEEAARAAQQAEARRQAEERDRAEQAAREAMVQRMAAERAAREEEAQRAPQPPRPVVAVPHTPVVQQQPTPSASISRVAASAHEIAGSMPRVRRPVRAHVRPARPLSRRDQDWRRAFSLAAGLSLGLVVGWMALAGRRPANPIPLQNLVQSPAVQQPVPFGPATIAPGTRKPSPSVPAASKPAPKPEVKPALRRARKLSSGDDQQLPDDVVIRHFGAKVQQAKAPAPVAQANTAKGQNGVKVFSDDQ